MRERNIVLPAASALLTLLSLACTTSTVEGPRVTDLPPGYGFSSQLSGARNVFLHERPDDEFGWMKARGEIHGSIEVNRWGRAMSEAEIRAARDEHVERYGYARYDEVRKTRIDGRDAWSWFVRQESSRECVAVIPYEDETFVVEYDSRFRDEQDDARMREVVASFRRRPGRVGKVLVPIGFAALFAGLVVAVRRMRS